MTAQDTATVATVDARVEALEAVTPYALGGMVERADGDHGVAWRLAEAGRVLALVAHEAPRVRTLGWELALAHTRKALALYAATCPYEAGSAEALAFAAGRYAARQQADVDAVRDEQAHDRLGRLAGAISVSPVGREQSWSGSVPDGFAVNGEAEDTSDPGKASHGVSVTYRYGEHMREALKGLDWPTVRLSGLGSDVAVGLAYERLFSLALAGAERERIGEQRPRGSLAQRAYAGGAHATVVRNSRKAVKAATAAAPLSHEVMASLARARMGTSER